MYYSYTGGIYSLRKKNYAMIEDFINEFNSAIYYKVCGEQYLYVPTLYDAWNKQPVSFDYIVSIYHQVKTKREADWHKRYWGENPYTFRQGPVPGISSKRGSNWWRSPRYIQQIRENSEYNRGDRISLVKWEDPPIRGDCHWRRCSSWKNNKKRSHQWDR